MDQNQASSASSLMRLIQANPLDLEAYCKLADVYLAAGELGKADLTLHRAIEIDPLHYESWVRLGIAYSNQGDWQSAVDALEQACALDGAGAAAWVAYGIALIATQNLSEATTVRDVLLTRYPRSAETHLIAGHISKICGQVETATLSYRHALEIDPNQTEAIFNIVDLSPPAPSDPLVLGLESALGNTNLPPRQSANIRFALARIYERSGQVDRAFSVYQEANNAANTLLRELGNTYDPLRAEEETTRILEMFDSDVLANPLEPLDIDLRLIFIVGMPRSGTTLVERILSSHSRVSAAGELPFMRHYLSGLLSLNDSQSIRGRLRLEDPKQRQFLLDCRETYLDRIFDRDLGGDYVIDKLPANFAALGLIRVLFPGALIVHCVRDPMATCWSLYTAHFGAHLAYYTAFDHLVHYYKNIYCKSMAHWRKILSPPAIDVVYEQLVTTPDQGIRGLLTRCELPWEDACLKFYENDKPIYTASMQQARLPVSASSVSRWRTYARHLAPMMEGFGNASPGD